MFLRVTRTIVDLEYLVQFIFYIKVIFKLKLFIRVLRKQL